MKRFLKGMRTGALASGICGVVGGGIVAGVTALCGGPVAIAAAIGVGLFGLFGAALGAVDCGTSPSAGDYRGNWAAGLALTAALAGGAYAFFAPSVPSNAPPKAPAAISMIFNSASDAAKPVAPAVIAPPSRRAMTPAPRA